MLDKLREMTGGDEDRIKLYVAAFMEEMPSYADKLQKAIEEKDLENIRYVAHISKPLLSMMGFEDLHLQADQLEKRIRTGCSFSDEEASASTLHTSLIDAIEKLKKLQ